MKIKKLLTIITLAVLLMIGISKNNTTNVVAQEVKDERELKAVWVSSFIGEAPYNNETQFKRDMTEMLDIMDYFGYNAVIYHVRTHNNAFYKSDLNPKASYWRNANFDDFDPLTWLINETHKRGIEFHAWMNPYRVATGSQVGDVPISNPQNDPENLIKVGNSTILNPALENVRQHIYDTIIEFMELYPTVEAIHFDDYFYINGASPELNANEKREHVNALIEGIHYVLKDFNQDNDTNVQLGISPTGIYRNGNGVVEYYENGHARTSGSATGGQEHYSSYLFADTVRWANEGWIDYLMPQVYWARNHPIASFTKVLSWWDKVFKHLDVNLYSGIGIYMADSSNNTYDWQILPNELDEQLTEIEDLYENVEGYSLFSYKHLKSGYYESTLKSSENIIEAYEDNNRTSVRVLPVIKNMEPKYVDIVTNVNYNDGLVTWDSVEDSKFYYIYKSEDNLTYSSDEIIGVVGNSDEPLSFEVENDDNYNYGVRALSKTNHLSEIPGEVNVSFDLGYEGLTLPSLTKEEGTILLESEVNNPTRAGYNFLGWYLGNTLYDFSQALRADLTLLAKWDVKDYTGQEITVMFDLGYNNLVLPDITIEKGSILSKPEDPERLGYEFIGWYNEDEEYLFNEPLLEGLLLVAKWEANVEVENFIEMIDGASIRNSSDSIQRLRFYARLDSSLLEAQVGMFAIFGDATTEQLVNKLIEAKGRDIYINNQRVLKREITHIDENNEFSVVLIGIPPKGYADRITVIAYAVDNKGVMYLAQNPITRSTLEVAVKMAQVNESIQPSVSVLNYALENMKKLSYDVYGNLEITTGLYEYNHHNLKEQFYNDFKNKFNINLNNLSAIEFYNALKEGSNTSEANSTDISNTNIYKFFHDPLYKIKWSWLLDYMIDVDYTNKVKEQAEAIIGNGSNNSKILYNASNFSYSLYNFFNESYEVGNDTAIDFLSEIKNPLDNKDKYDRYRRVKTFNIETFVDVSKHMFFHIGDKINLPLINKEISGNQEYVYFDGEQYVPSHGQYHVKKELTFAYKIVSVESFRLTFFDGENEFLELKDYYLSSKEKELPIPYKVNYTFGGWYLNEDFSGPKLTKIDLGSTGNKTLYAKFEPISNLIIVNYDLGEYGYHTTNKQVLFDEFVRDYRNFYGRIHSVDSMLDDFFATSYLPLPYLFADFFADDQIYEKWGWLEVYILEAAELNNYVYLQELKDYSQSYWRINIHAFFNDMFHVHYGNDRNYPSIEFNNLRNANNFWQLTEFNTYQAKYKLGESLVDEKAVYNWAPNYKFVGWYDEEDNHIEDLGELSYGEHNLKAKWELIE